MKNLFKHFVERAAAEPVLFTFVRSVLEAGYAAEKRVIRAELSRDGQPYRLLDLGCGTGSFASLFNPRGYIGLDLSTRFVGYAVRHVRDHHFCCGDAHYLPFPDGHFEAALLLGLLHHLSDEDARAVMAEVGRVVCPGGRVLLIEDAQDEAHGGAGTANALSHLGVRLFQWADVGEHIRPGAAYAPLANGHLGIAKRFNFYSGVCYYQGLLLERTG